AQLGAQHVRVPRLLLALDLHAALVGALPGEGVEGDALALRMRIALERAAGHGHGVLPLDSPASGNAGAPDHDGSRLRAHVKHPRVTAGRVPTLREPPAAAIHPAKAHPGARGVVRGASDVGRGYRPDAWGVGRVGVGRVGPTYGPAVRGVGCGASGRTEERRGR